MARTAFLSEIINQHLAFDDRYLAAYMPYIRQYLSGQVLTIADDLPPKQIKLYSKTGLGLGDLLSQTKPNHQDGSVAVIPLHGMITKRGSWHNYGADEIEEMLTAAYQDEGVKAIVLDAFTPGGSTMAAPTLYNALKNAINP